MVSLSSFPFHEFVQRRRCESLKLCLVLFPDQPEISPCNGLYLNRICALTFCVGYEEVSALRSSGSRRDNEPEFAQVLRYEIDASHSGDLMLPFISWLSLQFWRTGNET